MISGLVNQLSSIGRRYAIVATVIMSAFFVLQWINGRDQMYDFQVYYGAASELLQGNTPYGKSFGVSSGIYKYSPISVFFFVPFALIPLKVASSIYYFLIVLALPLCMLHLFRKSSCLFYNHRYQGIAMLLVTVVLSDVFIRELHLGNINLLLLGLFLLAIRQMEHRKYKLAGIIIAIGILIKPHFLILLPWLVMRAKWTTLISVVTGLVVGLLLPVLFRGWEGNTALLYDWYGALTIHNFALWESPNTLFGLINSAFFAPFGKWGGNVLVLCTIGITGLLYLYWMHRHGWQNVSLKTQYLEYIVLIALIPNLTHTDTEHFLFATPLMVLLAGGIFDRAQSIWVYAFIYLVIGIPFFLNSPDLFGPGGAEFMDQSGLLGLSSFLFIVASLIMVRFLPEKS